MLLFDAMTLIDPNSCKLTLKLSLDFSVNPTQHRVILKKVIPYLARKSKLITIISRLNVFFFTVVKIKLRYEIDNLQILAFHFAL